MFTRFHIEYNGNSEGHSSDATSSAGHENPYMATCGANGGGKNGSTLSQSWYCMFNYLQ